MASGATARKLAAIMIADLVGFSRLMEHDESLSFARLRSPVQLQHFGKYRLGRDSRRT